MTTSDEVPGIRLYFHHIPKTAGMSVREYLISRIGESGVSPLLRSVKFRDAMRDYARFAAITGHLDVVPGDTLPSDRTSITVLREPVDRVVSTFYFLQSSVYTAARHGVDADASDLPAWLTLLEEKERTDSLNGLLAFLWPLGWSEQSTPPIPERVAAAKRALEAFDVVGMQQSMAESLTLMSYRLGIAPPDSIPHINHTRARPSVSDLAATTRQRLERLLAPDLEIYAHGLVLFKAQCLEALRAAAVSSASWRHASDSVRTGTGATARPDAAPVARQDTEAASTVVDRPAAAVVGRDEVRIQRAIVTGEMSGTDHLNVGETTLLTVHFVSNISVSNLTIGIAIRDDLDALVFGTNSHIAGQSIAVTPGRYVATFRFPNELGIGRYWVGVAAHLGGSHLEGSFDHLERACQFEVIDRITEYFEGRVRLRVGVKVTADGDEGDVHTTSTEARDSGPFSLLAYRNPALTEFAALLEPVAPVSKLPRAADATIRLRIRNNGSLPWIAFGKRPVVVSYHWFDSTGQMIVFDGLRTSLPRDIVPGESAELPCFLRTPEIAGRMRLVWTLVQEDVAWFGDRDAKSRFDSEIDVT